MYKYQKYQINNVEQSMEEICFPKNKEYRLLPQQAFLSDYLFDNQDINGLLIYHEIGSGKTCTAISIAEKYIQSIRKKGESSPNDIKIIVILPASLIGNFMNELRGLCPEATSGTNVYVTEEERKQLNKLTPNDKQYKDIMEKIDKRIEKYYTVYSYHKFLKEFYKGLINFNNSLVIIDEVQNMVSLSGDFYKTLLESVNKAKINFKLFLLSATPMFDNPTTIGLTFNLLRPKTEFPIGEDFEGVFFEKSGGYFIPKNIELFKTMSQGLVSYYRGDLPVSYPEMTLKTVGVKMSQFQLDTYKKAIKKENKENKKFKASMTFPTNFHLGPRMISNIAYPNGLSNDEGYESIKESFADIGSYSPKFKKIMEKVNETNGPVFVYSSFLTFGGIQPFVDYLEYLGYKNFDSVGAGSKRYAIYSGDESLDKREKIKMMFNKKENENGSVIKMIVGSPSTKEGISLLRVRQVHIMEPHWNFSRIKQIIGRAVRFCSHKDLPEDQRKVDVYMYLCISNDLKRSVDEYIWSLAKKKHKLISTFEKALKEVAIDCPLFIKRNSFPTDSYKLKCDNEFI
jgi:superfamily II DNA or RNA helicase